MSSSYSNEAQQRWLEERAAVSASLQQLVAYIAAAGSSEQIRLHEKLIPPEIVDMYRSGDERGLEKASDFLVEHLRAKDMRVWVEFFANLAQLTARNLIDPDVDYMALERYVVPSENDDPRPPQATAES